MDDLILVTWCERTNVTGVVWLLHACDVFGLDMPCRPERMSRRSYVNEDMMQSVIGPVFHGLDADTAATGPFPDMARVHDRADRPAVALLFRDSVTDCFAARGWRRGPAFFASPSCAMIWPLWAAAFPSAKWIIVRRADDDIVRGAMKHGHMNGPKTPEEWRSQYLDVYKARFREMVADPGVAVWHVWPEHLADENVMRKMIDWLGLTWQESLRMPNGVRRGY